MSSQLLSLYYSTNSLLSWPAQGPGSVRQNQVSEQGKNRTRNVRESGEETRAMGAEPERRELAKRREARVTRGRSSSSLAI